jgi:hypothetical protein
MSKLPRWLFLVAVSLSPAIAGSLLATHYGSPAIVGTAVWCLIGAATYRRFPKLGIGWPHDQEYAVGIFVGGAVSLVLLIVIRLIDGPNTTVEDTFI